jgi:hypothetical protein
VLLGIVYTSLLVKYFFQLSIGLTVPFRYGSIGSNKGIWSISSNFDNLNGGKGYFNLPLASFSSLVLLSIRGKKSENNKLEAASSNSLSFNSFNILVLNSSYPSNISYSDDDESSPYASSKVGTGYGVLFLLG